MSSDLIIPAALHFHTNYFKNRWGIISTCGFLKVIDTNNKLYTAFDIKGEGADWGHFNIIRELQRVLKLFDNKVPLQFKHANRYIDFSMFKIEYNVIAEPALAFQPMLPCSTSTSKVMKKDLSLFQR